MFSLKDHGTNILAVCFNDFEMILRQRAAAAKGRGSASTRREPRQSKAVPVIDANAELQPSLQVFHFSCSST